METATTVLPTTPEVVTEVSVLQRLDQMDAAINVAHSIIDKIFRLETEKNAYDTATVGSIATAEHCLNDLERLNSRLNDISELIGTL